MARFLELFRPVYCTGAAADIDLDFLISAGFDSLMLDLDNTLLPWKNSDIPPSSRAWIEKAKRLGMKICIVSNTHNPKRLKKIAAELDVLFIDRALKPRRSGFDRAVEMLECDRAHTVVVGDQILTDILGGNLSGMCTILVKPMHHTEFIGTKVSRLVERGILALLRRNAEMGTKPGPIQSETQDTK